METQQVETQDNIVDLVRKQIEYYFSPENLQSDAYLIQHMDANRSVPISVVMKFAKLKALTQDESVVRQALAESTVVVVGDRIKANIKPAGRSTIILRDVSSSATEESVREIFQYPGAKTPLSLRSDIGDTWFVTFESEQDAKDSLLDLKLKKRLFNGEPIKARIKTENVVRSYYSVPTMPPMASYGVYSMPYGPMGGPMDIPPFVYGAVPPESVDATATAVDAQAATVGGPADEQKQRTGTATTTGGPVRGANSTARTARTNATTGQTSNRDREGRRTGGEGRRTGTESRVNNREKDVTHSAKKPASTTEKPAVEINAVSFPPLQTADETPVPPAGYTGSYVKYSLDDIIAIVKEVKEAAIPVEVDAAAHSLALTVEPNLDLLRRQRTFSIDETREQLRQGRPVLKDAIIPGAVDYKSMMYGEHDKQAKKNNDEKKEAIVHVAETVAVQEPVGSSWAALVKSTAAIEIAPTPAVPVKTASPTKKANAAAASNNSKDKTADKDAAVSSSSSTTAKKGEKGEKKKSEKKKEEKVDKDHKDDTPVISWGGKASFANVLKQNLDEVVPPAVPASGEAKKAPVKADQSKATAAAPKSNNSNSANNNSKTVRREVDGKWAKESLPPVADK